MPDGESTRFCHREEERFPESEFVETEEHGWVHNVSPRHTTFGVLIEDEPPQKHEKKSGHRIPGPMRRR